MSIINQVLKDLDEREPLKTESGKYRLAAGAPAEQGPDYVRLAVWVVIAIAVIGAAVYYFWLEQQAKTVSEIKPVQASVQSQAVIAEPVRAETPATVEQKSEPSVVTMEMPHKARGTDQSAAVEYLPLKEHSEPLVAVVAAPKESQPIKVEPVKPVKPVEPVKVEPVKSRPVVSKPVKQSSEIVIVKSSKTGIALVKDLLETGRLTEAEKTLGEILDQTPNSLAAHELLTGLLLRNNRLQEAKNQLASARKFYPNNENLILLESRVLLEEGRVDDVIGLLKGLQSNGKAGIKSTAMLASLYQQKSEFSESLKLYNQLAKASPANSGYWMGLALSLDALNDPPKAKQAYTKALQTGGLSLSLTHYARQRISLINQQNNGKQ